MSSVDPRRSLELLRPEIEALNRDVAALTPEQWQGDSNCAGWQLADLVAHVVRNGWSFLAFVERALADDPTPPFGPAVQHIQDEIKAGGPRAAAERQRRETEEFVSLVQGLPESDLQKEGRHPQGARPIAWACTQRLAEAAFHHWDLRHSLGQDGPLDAPLAAHLLPFMLDPGGANIMTKSAEGATPDTFRLTSTNDGSAWRISAGGDGRTMEADASGPASLDVAAEAGWLALALYGRTPLAGAHFQVSGPPEAVERFRAAFGC
jgi:uncharacterized protein (TIGR03083 family)